MILAGCVLLGLAGVVGWFGGPAVASTPSSASASAPERRSPADAATLASWLLSLAAAVVFVVAGAEGLAGRSQRLPVDVMGGIGTASLRVDALSALFLVVVFGTAVPVLIAALAHGTAGRPRLPSAIALTLAATVLIVLADNLFLLLAGWETLGFAFFLVVGYDRQRAGRARSSVLAAGFSKLSGAAILVGGLLLVSQSHSLILADFGGHPGIVSDIAYALLVAGFAVKVGLVPAHIWLPPSYAAAPGPARAILAGVAVNVGFYGLWRTLDILGAPPVWLACVVLVVAGISAILGISHAAVHADLAELIGWSSVENAGVIVAGYGVALVGAIVHSPQLTAAGLLAGTAQICAHAVAKSLLFVSTSAIEAATETTDLDRLRGITRRLPFSGTGLVIGSMTLAGLPLTAGFASEWFTLEALMQQFRVHNLALQLCLAVAGVLTALTVGVASVAFVRVIGLTAFGHPAVHLHSRGGGDPARVEKSWPHRVGVGVLIACCLGLAMAAPLQVRAIASGLTPIVGTATSGALAGGLVLQPVYPGFSALSPSLLWIVIPGYMVVIALLTMAVSGRRFVEVRRAPAWTSGSRGVRGNKGYTSFAYANPIRKVLSALLLTRRELRPETQPADLASDVKSGTIESDIDATTPRARQFGYTVEVADVIERYLYRPLVPAIFAIVRVARRMQSGRLDAYMAYMLIALLAVVAVVTGLAPR